MRRERVPSGGCWQAVLSYDAGNFKNKEGNLENIISIIKAKRWANVTVNEFSALRVKIEETTDELNALQAVHRTLTGVDHVPDIRL